MEAPVTHDIRQRKADHLDLCATDEVAFRDQTTLLEQVRLVHQSLPDLDLDAIDTSVELLGKTLKAPIVIAGMTGGHERAAEVNHTLASIAEARGYGFGLGSQRAMQKRPDTAWTFEVREHAPTALLLGNVGVVQARDMDTEVIAKMIEQVGADALCVHMNPAMELVQPGGDRDFRGGRETVARLVKELPVPVVSKETGNGISVETARAVAEAGVKVVDTSGAGGTSWVGVETLRAEGDARELGELLWDWGVPTAASVHNVVSCGMQAIATGGMRNGVDAARALALGATAAGFARNVFKAFVEGGRDGAERFLIRVEEQIRAVMLLSGASTVAELRTAPRLYGSELEKWMALTDR
ncbi:MAG: type 2 isopentenyl-diphosphate Delta-isomerase [Deltaproteobacteria bacterium]|nr:type 2 isopentenyl-diphosphate Delta-isomerase [Deltaproteobacteria bacterium]